MNIHVRVALIFVSSTVSIDITIVIDVEFLERIN